MLLSLVTGRIYSMAVYCIASCCLLLLETQLTRASERCASLSCQTNHSCRIIKNWNWRGLQTHMQELTQLRIHLSGGDWFFTWALSFATHNMSHVGRPFSSLWSITYLSQDLTFLFLTSLFHGRNFQPPTVSVYYVTVIDPLYYGIQLTRDPR